MYFNDDCLEDIDDVKLNRDVELKLDKMRQQVIFDLDLKIIAAINSALNQGWVEGKSFRDTES
jgi:hypothetical protein